MKIKKTADSSTVFFFRKKPGNVLLLHKRTTIGAEVLNYCVRYGNRCVHFAIVTRLFFQNWIYCNNAKLSPRPISTSQLNTSPCVHLWPINLIISKGSYFLRMGNLILGGASRLDAFSVYPFRS